MLRLEDVHAFYGPVQVLFSIDLEVRDGEISRSSVRTAPGRPRSCASYPAS